MFVLVTTVNVLFVVINETRRKRVWKVLALVQNWQLRELHSKSVERM
jgi:hypothetical protein